MQTAQLKSVKPTPFQIEDAVPLPPHGNTGKAGNPGPLLVAIRALEVGQSTWAPVKPSTAWAAAAKAKKDNSKRFAMRQVDGGTRIWRTV